MDLRDFKNQLPRHKAIMGVDYGSKRLGIAVSDLLLMTANPYTVLNRRDINSDLSAIKKIIAEKEIGALVFGLPLQMDGREGETAAAARNFAEETAVAVNLPYAFWDERLSSSAVESFLIKEVDMSRQKRRQILDAGAAAYILQGFLDALATLK